MSYSTTALTPSSQASERRAPQIGGQGDESKARAYLRILVLAPERASDRLDTSRDVFIPVGAARSQRSGVYRGTLSQVGVSLEVLDAAGIALAPIGNLARRQYGSVPFTMTELARKSGVSVAKVRTVVAEDERAGRITRNESTARAVWYRLA
jgi:hypothetical protein